MVSQLEWGSRVTCNVCPGLQCMPWPAMYAPVCDVCPGLRMASPSQTCSPLRLSSLPTAIGRPGYSADDTFIPRTPDLRRAKISASFLLWFAYGEATTPALCYACRRPPPVAAGKGGQAAKQRRMRVSADGSRSVWKGP